ncbi:MAG: restriction endonuclease [Acidimicrobiales bacterium]
MVDGEPQSELADALAQFDRVEANLTKLDDIWREFELLVPDGICFGLDSRRSDQLTRAFTNITAALPAIDGVRIDAVPWSLDSIAGARFEALELGELDAEVDVERGINEPGRQLSDYRFRLERARSRLIRDEALDVMAQIDGVLLEAELTDAQKAAWRDTNRWGDLGNLFSRLDRLVGNMVPGRARWSDFHRHLRFAEPHDLRDILELDWPSVRAELEVSLYDDLEPIPVKVDDLGELVNAGPTGPVGTSLPWSNLSAPDFERLIFELVRNADGYENPNWLMPTHAADRGRDIEVYRLVNDPLAGALRSRVILQCKHWPGRAIGRKDLIECAESVRLWEPPAIDVLVVATSGRFSSDSVALVEKRRNDRTLPLIEPWADSHLETLLSRRPNVAASFGLR